MPKLEPTYLRYVYDGLNKGSLNAENASALPQGFIGLFEQEFTQKTPVSERKKVLNQLALWALFKGPVSVNLALAVLELEEEQMKDLVDIYSSWFNSPESGKYQLYHERLRVYLLQKLKAEEVQALNEKLISFLEEAVKQAKGEEDEYYALEHLHQHMALESQLGNHYERLHGYVNQESLWRRQIQLSKGYAWSQNAVQQGIKEGARRNHEMNTIRSTVNSVKLMTQEQNSAEDILNLLNEGDYLTALKRAETWEGERQFKLYLLFIHELTIGTSKEADFRKEACKAVLEAIDQTPKDHSVLDWCKFYPELAIYNYHEELLKMELDGVVIWSRGDYNLSQLIKEINAHKINYEIIINLAKNITESGKRKSKFYFEISGVLMDQNNLKEALISISNIQDNYWKHKSYLNISKILFSKGEQIESKRILDLSYENALLVDSSGFRDYKSIALQDVSERMMIQGHKEESLKIASKLHVAVDRCILYSKILKEMVKQGHKAESLEIASKIECEEVSLQDYIYSGLCESLIKQDDKSGALELLSKIKDNYYEYQSLLEFSSDLFNSGNKKESQEYLERALISAQGIHKKYTFKDESDALFKIADVLIKQENYSKAEEIIDKIYLLVSKILDDRDIDENRKKISFSYFKLKNRKKFSDVISKISCRVKRSSIYQSLSTELFINGDLERSEELLSKINDDNVLISKHYLSCSKSLYVKGDLNNHKVVIDKAIEFAESIKDQVDKYIMFFEISSLLSDQAQYKLSLETALKIPHYETLHNDVYLKLSQTLIEKNYVGKFKNAILKSTYIPSKKVFIPQNPNDEDEYLRVTKQLIQNKNLKAVFDIGLLIKDPIMRNNYCYEISKILISDGNFKDATLLASKINDIDYKLSAYMEIFKFFFKKEKKEESKNIFSEALKLVESATGELKSKLYLELSTNLIQIGHFNEAQNLAKNITESGKRKSKFYFEISGVLMDQNNLKEALISISNIQDNYWKHKSYLNISKILFSKGEQIESKRILDLSYENALLVDSSGFRDYKSIALQDVSERMMIQGHKEESLKIASKLHVAVDRCILYSKILKEMVKQGHKAESLEIASKIECEEVSLQDYIYSGLCESLIKQDDKSGALELLSKIKDNYYEYQSLLEFSSDLFNSGNKKESQEYLERALISAQGIHKKYTFKDESDALIKIANVLTKQENYEKAINVILKINSRGLIESKLTEIAKFINKSKINYLLSKIESKECSLAFTKGLAQSIKESNDNYLDINSFLFNYSQTTENLHDVLFYKTKMACFFEEQRNEEKLDMLNEVLDIKDLRRIRASA